jgi:hypothetical protein
VVTQVVEPYLADSDKTRILLEDGNYVRATDARAAKVSKNGFHFNAQEFLIGFAEGREALGEVPAFPRFVKFPMPVKTPAKRPGAATGKPPKS